MAYLAIKKVKGRYYGYMQESYREGGHVRTRTVEYLGAVEPAVARQYHATRSQLAQADMKALVQSVRDASQAASRVPEIPAEAPPPLATDTPPASEPPQHRYKRMKVNGTMAVVDTKTGALVSHDVDMTTGRLIPLEGPTQQRSRNHHRIFWRLLIYSGFWRFGGSQFGGMISGGFLGGRTPVES